MFCENCGSKLVDGARFCPSCGESVSPSQSEQVQQTEPVPPPPPDYPQTQAQPPQPPHSEQTQQVDPVVPPAPAYPQTQAYPPQQPHAEQVHQAAPAPPAYPPQGQGAYPPPQQYPPEPTPPKKRKQKVALIIVIAVVAFLGLLTAAYFLFIRGAIENAKALRTEPTESQTVTQLTEPTVVTTPSTTTETTTVTTTETTTETTPSIRVVNNELIYIYSDYDSGEGFYSGEVKDGLPHGLGTFEMVSSDSDYLWIYDGEWVEGEMHGEGIRMSGDYIFAGSFEDGYLNGYAEFYYDNVLLYEGDVVDGWLHGHGKLYTETSLLIYEGEFDYDMLVESEEERATRGEEFATSCIPMDGDMYYEIFDDPDFVGMPVEVWGYPLALSDQDETGTIVLGHFGEEAYPLVLNYRYGYDEPKITEDDWISAYGVITGLYEFEDDDGFDSYWPEIEVIYWTYIP